MTAAPQAKQTATPSATRNDSRAPFFLPAFIQPKLFINQPNDEYEQEADVVADKVMRMKANAANDFFFKPVNTLIQRKCMHCEEEEEQMQRKESGDTGTSVTSSAENYLSTLSGGKPLDENERNFFESKIGYDFSAVRIHNGHAANESAQNVSALAYTHGNDIVFGSGQYQPGTDEGKKLMAHELTHVVQQNSNGIQKGKIQRSVEEDTIAIMSDDEIEREMNAINDWLNEHQDESIESQNQAVERLYLLQAEHSSRMSVEASDQPQHSRQVETADEGTILSTLAGALMGEFNEDPSLTEIAIDTGVSLIPVVDQVADARDVTAHLYFMIFRGQVTQLIRWVGMVLSLIGLFPEVGTAIKGAGKIVILGATTALSRLADILEPFRRILPGSLDYRRIFDYVLSRWSDLVAFSKEHYRLILENISRLTSSFWLRLTGEVDEIRRIVRIMQSTGSQHIDDAFDTLRNYFQEMSDAILGPHALTADGMHIAIPDSPTHMEMRGSDVPGTSTSGSRIPVSSATTFTGEAARYLERSGGLTYLANQIKRLGQMRGATVEIALARLSDGRRIMVAGLNSSATWTAAQLAELRRLGIEVAPQLLREMRDGAPHAEENIARHIESLGGRGELWSRAVVGERGSYVCSACRAMVSRIGGIIEDGL